MLSIYNLISNKNTYFFCKLHTDTNMRLNIRNYMWALSLFQGRDVKEKNVAGMFNLQTATTSCCLFLPKPFLSFFFFSSLSTYIKKKWLLVLVQTVVKDLKKKKHQQLCNFFNFFFPLFSIRPWSLFPLLARIQQVLCHCRSSSTMS